MRGINRGVAEPLSVGLDVYSPQPRYRHYGGSEYRQPEARPAKEDRFLATRSPTPPAVLATDGGGGFWLASVAAGAGAGAVLPPHGTHPAAMEVGTPGLGSTETGFISSQPSMAEFMTALPQMGAEGPIQHSPGAPGGPMSPAAHHPGYHGMMDPHAVQQDGSGVNVPEYPWMKEKKTTRKSSQQGKRKARAPPATETRHRDPPPRPATETRNRDPQPGPGTTTSKPPARLCPLGLAPDRRSHPLFFRSSSILRMEHFSLGLRQSSLYTYRNSATPAVTYDSENRFAHKSSFPIITPIGLKLKYPSLFTIIAAQKFTRQ
jgi:hypothetical protein